MKGKIIVCTDENNAIGKNNSLLFHLKDDMRNFKELTTGNIVIIGRKTYESIGHPLPNRINFIISNTLKNNPCAIFNTVEDAMMAAKSECNNGEKDVFFIGGRQIYKEVLEKDYVDTIYLTTVHQKVEDADTWFPKIDYDTKWDITEKQSYTDEKYNVSYDICKLVKKV